MFLLLFQPPIKRIRLSDLFPSWEISTDLNLLAVQPCAGSWVLHDGSTLDPSIQSSKPLNTYLPTNFIASVIQGSSKADVSMLAFPDPNHFSTGSLHAHVPAWSTLASEASSFPLEQSVLNWLTNKVRVECYFMHFNA